MKTSHSPYPCGGAPPESARNPGTRYAWTLLFFLWLVAVATGFGMLTRYETTAGQPASAGERWPAGSRLAPAPGHPTLVVFLHPHCPCSRATVTELGRALAFGTEPVDCRVLFVCPAGMAAGWEQGELWERAAALPGVSVSSDAGGVEARHFGAATSGQAFLYDPSGRLVFRGGLTGARGHEGDNPGADAIRSPGPAADRPPVETPVFGCPLFDDSDPPARV